MTLPEPPQISILDARLAEIDTRLRTIQDELAPDAGESVDAGQERVSARPAAGSASTQPARTDMAELIEELRQLSDTHEQLLSTTRSLIVSYESTLAESARGSTAPDRVDISVGPLHSTEALRAFAQALSEIAGVQTVDLRGYEGGDRAVLDVQLEAGP